MDYSYYFMDDVEDAAQLQYDLFFSAFDNCERTTVTFDKVCAHEKYWLVFPQYEQKSSLLPDNYLTSNAIMEDEYILDVFENIDLSEKAICIDSTGFLIPHLLFLIQYLQRHKIRKFDILYSEPDSYVMAEDTVFTRNVNIPRPIEGYMASAKNVNGNDALIIFSGFNDTLVTAVARNNSKALYKYLFTGFPPLQADMYQQNLIQLDKSKESIGETHVSYLKAPAYDPFVAANKLQKIVNDLMEDKKNIEYIHISPLSTKPMAIAAALVYLDNRNCPIDIIYPPADTYICGHTMGIKRTWKYTLEF